MRVDDDVGAGELAELLQLRRRECGLHGPSPTEHHDLADARIDDRALGDVDRVGRCQLGRSEREHSRTVDRHVPVAHHDDSLGREVEREVLEVGMAVVPGDERRGRPRPREILPGNPEVPVRLRPDRVDDCVVPLDELGVRDRSTDVDVPEETEPGTCRRLLERARHRLDVLVVGSDAEPDEPPRRRQPVEQVHHDRGVFAAKQRIRRIEPGRTCPDDGNAKRRAHARERIARVSSGSCRSRRRPQAPRRRRPGSSSHTRTTRSRSGCRS